MCGGRRTGEQRLDPREVAGDAVPRQDVQAGAEAAQARPARLVGECLEVAAATGIEEYEQVGPAALVHDEGRGLELNGALDGAVAALLVAVIREIEVRVGRTAGPGIHTEIE